MFEKLINELFTLASVVCFLQCFDAVGWVAGRASGLQKKLSGGVLVWLSVWSEVQTCIWTSWCHCHSLSLASVKSRLVLPSWYRLTRVVPEKGLLCVCVCVVSVVCMQLICNQNIIKSLLNSTKQGGNNDSSVFLYIIHSLYQDYSEGCKIGEHLSKLRAKSLIVSYTPFSLHFCPQRCRSRQISWITCVCRQKLLLSVAVLTGRLKWVNYQEISDCYEPVLTYRLTPSVTDWLLIMYGILPRQLFFVAAVVYIGSWDFLYGRCKQLFVSELNNA